MGIMTNKGCIVTGAAGSIGLASVSILLREGAKVMMVDRNEDNLIRSLKALDSDREKVDIVRANVARAEDTKSYINETVAKWGKIDVLFSHAGRVGEWYGFCAGAAPLPRS